MLAAPCRSSVRPIITAPDGPAGPSYQTDQGNRRDANALRLQTDSCVAQTGRLECQSEADLSSLQGVGTPAPQQNTKAPGQGEAAGGSASSHTHERNLGDGLRARSTGDRAQAPRAHYCRHLLALLASAGCPVQLRGADVVEVLEQVGRQHGFPSAIRVDQGTEFVSAISISGPISVVSRLTSPGRGNRPTTATLSRSTASSEPNA